MAFYTTELKTICESLSNLSSPVGYAKVAEIIDAARPYIFDFPYPIFDESYKSTLEKKIIYHYYTREIGLETYGLWHLKLQTKLNEIMPYYNELYNSTVLNYNPLYTTDLTRQRLIKHTGSDSLTGDRNNTVTGDTKNTVTGSDTRTLSNNDNVTETGTVKRDSNNREEINKTTTNQHKDAFSDTPQGQITNVDNYTYLTDYRNINDSGTEGGNVTNTGTATDTNNLTTERTAQGTDTLNVDRNNNTTLNQTTSDKNKQERTVNNQDEYIETVTGKADGSSYSALIKEFRETLLNIDMMIIEELRELFMGVWA